MGVSLWLIALILLCVFCLLFVIVAFLPQVQEKAIVKKLFFIRTRFRWFFIVISFLLMILVFQYSHWGNTPNIHWVVFVSLTLFVSFCLSKAHQTLITYTDLLAGIIITGSVIITFVNLIPVTDFPFSLSWSEGNRIWDYSIPFGRALYDYPTKQPIFVYTDLGRRLLFGLPFLLLAPSIEFVRFWMAIVSFVPYAVLGWIVLSKKSIKGWLWFLAGLWLFSFLYQGGVYAPLIIVAIFVVWACWYSPTWVAVILTTVVGFYVYYCRIHWVIAPAVWGILLTLSPLNSLGSKGTLKEIIKKAMLLTFSASIGGFYFLFSYIFTVSGSLIETSQVFYVPLFFIALQFVLIGLLFINHFIRFWNMPYVRTTSIVLAILLGAACLYLFSQNTFPLLLAGQSLLWYRLFPSPTHSLGILLSLFIAVTPLIIFLTYCYQKRIWHLTHKAIWMVILPLLLFLGIGLIVSVKIGGGNNLHNLDLFTVTCVLVAGIAWRNGVGDFLSKLSVQSIQFKGLFLILVIIPFLLPMQQIRPLALPSVEYTIDALNQIRVEVEKARAHGEILFIDQRQLLTFGYIQVPLVVEYEKKLLQDRALSQNETYFKSFYDDLKNHRFSLIISSPLKTDYTQVNDAGEIFGEENNAWVHNVAKPLLRYYEPIFTLKKAGVQLLVSRANELE